MLVLVLLGTAAVTAGPLQLLQERDGRHSRSPQQHQQQQTAESSLATASALAEASENLQESDHTSGFDLALIHRLAGASSQPIVRGGGYGGRKRRAALRTQRVGQESRAKRSPQGHRGLVDSVQVKPHGDSGDLALGAKLQTLGQAERRGRAEQGGAEVLTNEIETSPRLVKPVVALEAVKVKSHGSQGWVVQGRAPGSAVSSGAKRQRRSNGFIPFSEYEATRVDTLKVEQNDALALSERLKTEAAVGATNPENIVKKRHFQENQ